MLKSRIYLLLLTLLIVSTASSAVDIVRVWPAYQTAEKMTALREYFGGEPNRTSAQAIRSQPEARAGYYWLIRTKSDRQVPDATIKLEVTMRGDTDAEMFKFPTLLQSGSHAFHIGLTGSDWPDPEQAPLAWRITVVDSRGEPIAEQSSYLWNAN